MTGLAFFVTLSAAKGHSRRAETIASIIARNAAQRYRPCRLPDVWREDLSGLEWCPGCHPERSEGSLRPSSQTLRCAQGDRHDLQMSGATPIRLPRTRQACYTSI